jgi:hypothetical protein
VPTGALGRGLANASSNGLALARMLEVLGPGPSPERLSFLVRESPVLETHALVPARSSRDEERLELLLPSITWSADRRADRLSMLFPRPLAALGLRHGMVGEALYSISARTDPRPFASTVVRPALRQGFGLFALDWIPRLQHEDSPFMADAELARAIDLQQALEAARLLASLELHAEGLSVEEALVAFLRRTEVDPDQARAEVLTALLDPTHGLGALVRHELRELETRLERLLGPSKALPRLLRLVLGSGKGGTLYSGCKWYGTKYTT